MSQSLDGKVALVTGVSGDGQVGQTVAQALAAEGASLVIAARTQANLEARAQELRARGTKLLSLAADLTKQDEVNAAIEKVIKEFGRIDILVNLAGGLTRYKPLTDHSLDDWQHEIDNNLLTAFLCACAVFPHMRAAGSGTIVNFTRAGKPQANMAAYNCAKAGVEALTRTLALEGRDFGIRVNAVAPGLVNTHSNIKAMQPKNLKFWTSREDIARATVFLVSEASAGVTGQVLPVTGWGL